MRVGFVEWPEGLQPAGAEWTRIVQQVADAHVEFLVTNEMPFGPWISSNPTFDGVVAQNSVDAHVAGVDALSKLAVPVILSSRPVWAAERLANEAFIVESGALRPVHRKQYFPSEAGWFEANWYVAGRDGFKSFDTAVLRVGVMLCTDLMFNEHARRYGREGASLIAVPRAAGVSSASWHAAAKMAAIVSGCYVISSNRVGRGEDGPTFGGAGFAYHPDGTLLATTTAAEPMLVVDVDPVISARQQGEYPCYVLEPDGR